MYKCLGAVVYVMSCLYASHSDIVYKTDSTWYNQCYQHNMHITCMYHQCEYIDTITPFQRKQSKISLWQSHFKKLFFSYQKLYD
jgi:hypothetical protein